MSFLRKLWRIFTSFSRLSFKFLSSSTLAFLYSLFLWLIRFNKSLLIHGFLLCCFSFLLETFSIGACLSRSFSTLSRNESYAVSMLSTENKFLQLILLKSSLNLSWFRFLKFLLYISVLLFFISRIPSCGIEVNCDDRNYQQRAAAALHDSSNRPADTHDNWKGPLKLN